MLRPPSRFGAFALISAAGYGFAGLFSAGDLPSVFLTNASAQTTETAPAPATGQSPIGEVVHTDAKGRHLAPHDTFYLVSYVSVTTDKGVEGFVPGQEVRFVSVDREKHMLVVSDGRAQVEVSPSKLTNDLDIAAMVREKDEAKQARIAAFMEAEDASYQKYERETAAATAKDFEQRKQVQAAEARAEEATPAPASQPAQPVNASADTNGYYGSGGYGYGSPYSYFTGGTAVATPNTGGKGSAAASTAAGNKAAAPAGHAGGGKPK